jgi:hypothetical protein
MNNTIGLLEPQKIGTWFSERCHLEQDGLRNEFAFMPGDYGQRGPARQDLAATLKGRLTTIAKHPKVITSPHELS